ncbi:hypothetical protein NQZ68_007218 [Dissostichus eleginoides]|nr:hypothetical protein NQZ68_007218 [Dissostichus eleginoides]
MRTPDDVSRPSSNEETSQRINQAEVLKPTEEADGQPERIIRLSRTWVEDCWYAPAATPDRLSCEPHYYNTDSRDSDRPPDDGTCTTPPPSRPRTLAFTQSLMQNLSQMRVSAVTEVWQRNSDGLTPNEQNMLLQLLLEFNDCFSLSEADVCRKDLIEHNIDTGD